MEPFRVDGDYHNMSNDAAEARLETLREEFAKGEQMLIDLEREAIELRESLLRISGAIQVLEELQAEEQPS